MSIWGRRGNLNRRCRTWHTLAGGVIGKASGAVYYTLRMYESRRKWFPDRFGWAGSRGSWGSTRSRSRRGHCWGMQYSIHPGTRRRCRPPRRSHNRPPSTAWGWLRNTRSAHYIAPLPGVSLLLWGAPCFRLTICYYNTYYFISFNAHQHKIV